MSKIDSTLIRQGITSQKVLQGIKRYTFNLLFVFLVYSNHALFAQKTSQDVFFSKRVAWLKKAEDCKPKLFEWIKKPMSVVNLVRDTNAFQGWKAEQCHQELSNLYDSSFKKKSGIILDFGEHLTGYFTITIKSIKGTPDGPLRLKFTFTEMPAALATSFDPYQGSLSRAWLQDEVVTVMNLPARITLPRRVAFRYLKIDLLGCSPFFDFAITAIEFKAASAVSGITAQLEKETNPIISKIDKVGLATLKECMQTVYEDGPKRDRRLWIGDFYLEAMANAQSFKNYNLTKRCLYLLAGLCRDDGFLNSNVFEKPEPHPQVGSPFLFDYALLYNAAVKDYLESTGDYETAQDLWPVVKKQLESPLRYLRTDGIFDVQQAVKNNWWLFVDWNKALDREAAIQGIIIYSMKQSYQLAQLLGKEKEVSYLPSLISRMTTAAREKFYNKKTGLFESGPQKQISFASQAWMVLSDVATKSEAQKALRKVFAIKNAIKPGTPYLYHYVVAAMIKSGMSIEAKEMVMNYWGGMVRKGADTFWEVYDPDNDYLSPYGFFPVNSYCHAWSCTPVYFIRKYPEIFQK